MRLGCPDNEISQKIAANIKLARKQGQFSQADLAKMVGCSGQALWYWETCQREIPNDMVIKVATALGKSWLWFYQDHSGEVEHPKPTPTEPATAESAPDITKEQLIQFLDLGKKIEAARASGHPLTIF